MLAETSGLLASVLSSSSTHASFHSVRHWVHGGPWLLRPMCELGFPGRVPSLERPPHRAVASRGRRMDGRPPCMWSCQRMIDGP